MKAIVYPMIGVMSGTSLDGIDLVYVSFEMHENWNYQLIKCETIEYTPEWVKRLSRLVENSKEELNKIDFEYTNYLADVIKGFINRNRIEQLDAVCSHGHTALHRPKVGITYQIGNRPELAKLLGTKVICDFRVQDVKLGGQGAPLVPIGDRLLFSDYDFCLNLGGFANISTEVNNYRIAYDICPANIVLNKYVQRLHLNYDDEGKLARSGRVDEALLVKLNNLEFYNKNYPKSLGLEWVNQKIHPLIDSFEISIEDILSTFCEHIAIQISKEINKKNNASVFITGGGAYNIYLLERLKSLSNNEIVIPENNLIEYKEALIFALLGVLKMRDENNCLKSVTGASRDHSSGVIFNP